MNYEFLFYYNKIEPQYEKQRKNYYKSRKHSKSKFVDHVDFILVEVLNLVRCLKF